jgi:hypothetical protein
MSDYNPVAISMDLGAKLSKLERGEVVDSNNYWSFIGSLKYLTCMRPGIVLTISVASQFMEDQRYSHLKTIKRIMRYIKVIEGLVLHYTKTNKFELISYVDSNWCGDVDDRKNTSGYAFFKRGIIFHMVVKKNNPLSHCRPVRPSI